MRRLFVICAAVCLGISVYAGDAGRETPFSAGAGARALGMGGAFSALAYDASAVYYNPAGLPLLENQEVSLMHMVLFEGTIYNYAAWVYPDSKLGGFGIGYFRIGTDDIVRRQNYVESGRFDYSHSQFLISYGRKAGDRMSMGLSLKLVNQSLDSLSDYGLGLDFGLMLLLSKHVTGGFAVRELIPAELELASMSESAPVSISTGLGIKELPLSPVSDLSASFELEKTEQRDAKIHAGMELLFTKAYALRAGYDKDNFTFGAGLQYRRLKVDYAYKIMDYIEDSHRFSLSFLIGTSISDQLHKRQEQEAARGTELLEEQRRSQFEFYRSKADDYYDQFRLDSALAYYQRALAFDERNEEIIGLIAAIEGSIQVREEAEQKIRQTQTDLTKATETYFNQAQNFFAKKYFRASLDMLNLIFDIDPTHSEAIKLRDSINASVSAEIALELQNAQKAETEGSFLTALVSYNKILDLDPQNQMAQAALKKIAANMDIAQQLNKGIEIYNAGNLERARTTFNAVLSIDPQNPVALEYLKKIELAGAKPTTLEDLQKDKLVWQLYLDGLRYMRNREYQQAIDAWEQVLKAYPNNINTLNNIEQARLRLKSEQFE